MTSPQQQITARDIKLVQLIGLSLTPRDWNAGVDSDVIGSQASAEDLRTLALPSVEWMRACVAELLASGQKWVQFVEAIQLLGSNEDPVLLYQDAYVFVRAVLEPDVRTWVNETLSDPVSNHIIDDLNDYDLADDIIDVLDYWVDEVPYQALRMRFLELAKFGVANQNGKSPQQVLEAAGLI